MDIRVHWRHTAYKGHMAYKDILVGRIHKGILKEYGRTRPN
jgi:hypothetical protein